MWDREKFPTKFSVSDCEKFWKTEKISHSNFICKKWFYILEVNNVFLLHRISASVKINYVIIKKQMQNFKKISMYFMNSDVNKCEKHQDQN